MPQITKSQQSIPSQWNEAMSASHAAAGSAAWEDWDISAIVGAGRVTVLVLVHCITASTGGVRTNGSALERRIAMIAGENLIWTVNTDANGIIDVYDQIATRCDFYVVGWFS